MSRMCIWLLQVLYCVKSICWCMYIYARCRACLAIAFKPAMAHVLVAIVSKSLHAALRRADHSVLVYSIHGMHMSVHRGKRTGEHVADFAGCPVGVGLGERSDMRAVGHADRSVTQNSASHCKIPRQAVDDELYDEF
jgi:hypothetical protein